MLQVPDDDGVLVPQLKVGVPLPLTVVAVKRV
jgi:hypothetical protein